MQDYRITTDLNEMDFEAIHGFLSESYWSAGIPKATLRKGLENSLCFGILDGQNRLVGFGRMVTDKATFAYLADVFVVEAHRGKGLSKWLVSTIQAHPDLQGLRRIMLATGDAHGLYAQFGFEAIAQPEILMQIWQPNIYQSERLDTLE
ncbi:GNAT family N-acetyltransferase [Parasalinivibrio latis]|uniref:GNAT family N-acetyltransferase n=1 Tax=Parasalinivibrio latis TaxID=2952610 RepID=UPI0030E2A122